MFEQRQPEEEDLDTFDVTESEDATGNEGPPRPDDLRSQRFILSFLGYDRAEVHAYLSYLADLLEGEELAAGSATAAFDAVGEEVTRILRTTTEAAEEIRKKLFAETQKANSEAERLRAEAEAALAQAKTQADAEAHSIIEQAEARAAKIVTEGERRDEDLARGAESRASAVIDDAQAQAQTIVLKAKEEAEHIRSTHEDLRAKLAGLEQALSNVRKQLNLDR